jgi:uncharacterized small protein (DUF1192 family)
MQNLTNTTTINATLNSNEVIPGTLANIVLKLQEIAEVEAKIADCKEKIERFQDPEITAQFEIAISHFQRFIAMTTTEIQLLSAELN